MSLATTISPSKGLVSCCNVVSRPLSFGVKFLRLPSNLLSNVDLAGLKDALPSGFMLGSKFKSVGSISVSCIANRGFLPWTFTSGKFASMSKLPPMLCSISNSLPEKSKSGSLAPK